MNKLYGGIDLHANNSMIVILDDQDRVVFRKRLPNKLDKILAHLAPYRAQLHGLVVESTYNWYWLVDGLMDAGYTLHLANPVAIQQYTGLKHTDDESDAAWLAHLLRLGILPTGYIYPKEARPVRDLLRKRSQFVRQDTMQNLSIQNVVTRNTGATVSGKRIKQFTPEAVQDWFPTAELALAVQSSLAVRQCLDAQIQLIERTVLATARLSPSFQPLLTVYGIGKILALTIMLETGDIRRFATVGQFASYCRCVSSTKLSNGKRKGQGNTKDGNKYLAWAFVEAAHFAVRYYPPVQRFHHRKKAKTNAIVASKAVAHKLARACYYVMRDQVPFDPQKAFAG